MIAESHDFSRGSVSKKDDKCILENFCYWFEIDTSHIKTIDKIVNGKQFTYARLELYGNFFKTDFSKYGIISNKTYNPIIPEIPINYIKPFLIGLIDADGNICFNKSRKNSYILKNGTKSTSKNCENSISLVGHPLIMDWVIKSFELIGFKGNINSQIVKNKWKRIRIQRKQDVIDLSKLLEIDNYYSFCLKRKWESLYLNNSLSLSTINT